MSTMAVAISVSDSISKRVSSALERLATASADEAKAIRDDAELIEELMRRRGYALDAIYPIAELKLQAERSIGEKRLEVPRAMGPVLDGFDWEEAKRLADIGKNDGQIARELRVDRNSVKWARQRGFVKTLRTAERIDGKTPLRAFDEAIGVKENIIGDWQRLARIPDDQLDRVVDRIKENGAELTTSRVLYESGVYAEGLKGMGIRVEPGIYRLPDGRYRISYSKNGKHHRETLKTKSLDVARRTKLTRRGLGKTKKIREDLATLDRAYAAMRQAFDMIDAALPALCSDARRAAESALAHGYKASDELLRAMNISASTRRAA